MRNSPFWWILIGFMVLVDIYFFQALKAVSHGLPKEQGQLFILVIGLFLLLQ
jgi:hypothetical protein